MERFFLNYTNHASTAWSQEQRRAAEAYGHIVDVPFPTIDACWSEEDISRESSRAAEKLLSMRPAAVLCQGEYTYCYELVRHLRAHGIIVLAACSERMVREMVDETGRTHRQTIFSFVRFRKYA